MDGGPCWNVVALDQTDFLGVECSTAEADEPKACLQMPRACEDPKQAGEILEPTPPSHVEKIRTRHEWSGKASSIVPESRTKVNNPKLARGKAE